MDELCNERSNFSHKFGVVIVTIVVTVFYRNNLTIITKKETIINYIKT